MAVKTVFLDYFIHIPSRFHVDHMNTANPNGWPVAPDFAAAHWSASVQFVGSPFVVPAIRSPHFTGQNNNYPRNVPIFSRKTGGWFGISWLFGDVTQYHWRGRHVYAPPREAEIEDTPTQPVVIARRKWIEGFEVQVNGESNGNVDASTGQCVTRDSSRHPDGFGLSIRHDFSTPFTRAIADISGVSASLEAWERFYIRIRRTPNVETLFWRMTNTSANGMRLKLTTANRISIYSLTGGGGVETLITSPADVLEEDTWYRLDVIYRHSTTTPIFKIYLGRTKIADLTPAQLNASGLSAATNHVNSSFGHSDGTSRMELDVDDWICSEWPAMEASSDREAGLDWVNGSKVKLARPKAFHEDHGSWAAEDTDWRVLLQTSIPANVTSSQALASSTASDPLVVETDAVREIAGLDNSAGIAAFSVCCSGNDSANTTFGYRLNGAAAVQQARGAGTGWKTMMYRPSGIITPDPVTDLRLLVTKDSGGGTVRIAGLVASVEVLGIYGDEDIADEEPANPDTIPPRRGTHNAPYPESPWAREGAAPAPIINHGGTYVGNGTGQDLAFRIPVNWLWIRRIDNSPVGGAYWWSSMRGPHRSVDREITPDSMVRAQIDPDFTGTGELEAQEQQTLIRIAGNRDLVNENGVTYQFIACCDPAARIMINGAFHHDTNLSAVSNALFKAGFLPLAAFFTQEDSGADPADTLGYKGVGHAATAGSLLTAAETATYAAFDTGEIITEPALHSGTEDCAAYSSWRLNPDGNVMVQIVSYTGDGTGQRTIALTPVSGRRPMFGLVVPHNGGSFQRDPSHTGTSSSSVFSTLNGATAIVGGGIDEIIVGSALNTNGVVYDVFVLPGSTQACENGWSCNTEYIDHPDTDDEDDIDPPDDDDDDDDDEDDDPDEEDQPIDPPSEFPFTNESERARAIRLSNLCARVLHRLGDSDQKIWTESEIDGYIQQAMFQMVTAVRLIWDQLYLENIPPGFHCTFEQEEDLLEFEFQYGRAACTYEWELEYGEDGDLWEADDVDWANHTSPADRLHLSHIGEQRATAELPRPLVEIERCTWDHRTIDALSVRELTDNDTRYELTEGEVFGYTWRKDGVRTYRKVRKPNVVADLVTHDGIWGIPRNVDDVSDDDTVTGTWGIPRRIRGWHPMGSTVGFGTERRFYEEGRNVKVEHWRKFDAECKMSEIIDGAYMALAGEIPRHYFLYIADYCQWQALKRRGPGTNYKLAQLYKDRWDRDLGRLYDRVNRANNQRLIRAGGNDPSPRGKPPRPRLPWNYGSKVR